MSLLPFTSKPYLDALHERIALQLPEGMALEDLTIGPPKRMASGEVRCPIRIPADSFEKSGWHWYGACEYRHTLIPLSQLFVNHPVVTMDFPVTQSTFTSTDVADYLFATYGVHFDLQDYQSGEYTVGQPAVFKTAGSSLRYQGSLTIQSTGGPPMPPPPK